MASQPVSRIKILQSLNVRVPTLTVTLLEEQYGNCRASRHRILDGAPLREVCSASCHALSVMYLPRGLLMNAAVIVTGSVKGSGYIVLRTQVCIW